MEDNYCPGCKDPLPIGASQCSCGWRKGKAVGGIKCLCGRHARITFKEKYLCWPCYENTIAGTDIEDWRNKLLREEAKKLGIYGNEHCQKAKELFKSMGGAAKLLGGKR